MMNSTVLYQTFVTKNRLFRTNLNFLKCNIKSVFSNRDLKLVRIVIFTCDLSDNVHVAYELRMGQFTKRLVLSEINTGLCYLAEAYHTQTFLILYNYKPSILSAICICMCFVQCHMKIKNNKKGTSCRRARKEESVIANCKSDDNQTYSALQYNRIISLF